jgi:hypothetical protein
MYLSIFGANFMQVSYAVRSHCVATHEMPNYKMNISTCDSCLAMGEEENYQRQSEQEWNSTDRSSSLCLIQLAYRNDAVVHKIRN